MPRPVAQLLKDQEYIPARLNVIITLETLAGIRLRRERHRLTRHPEPCASGVQELKL